MKTKFYKIIYFCFAFCLMLSTVSILSGFMQVGSPSESWAASAVAPTKTLTRIDPDDKTSRTYTLIESEGNLAWLMTQTTSTSFTKNYLLTKNLDMGNATWTAIGAYTTSTKAYSGVFNGDGHFIKGLKCSVTTSYSGLFAQVSGTVKNVYLENSSFQSACYAGSIAGYLTGTIKNCGVYKCSVTALYSSYSSIYAGGVVGYMQSGTIQRVDCTGTGTITGNQPSDKKTSTGYVYAGGIAAYLSSGTIKSCYNAVEINGYTFPTYAYIGGIVGRSSGTVTECTNKAPVRGGDGNVCNAAYVGGIVGYSSTNVTNCSNFGSVKSYAKEVKSNEKNYAQTSWDDWGICGSFDIYRKYNETSYMIEIKSYAGGIVGYLTSNKSVTYSYNTASTIKGGGKYYHYSGTYGAYGYNDRWILSDQKTNEISASASKTHILLQYGDAICGNSRVSDTAGTRSVSASNCYSVYDFNTVYSGNSETVVKNASYNSGTPVAKFDGDEKCRLSWYVGTNYDGFEYGLYFLAIKSDGWGTNGTEPIGAGYSLAYYDSSTYSYTAFEKTLSKLYTTKSSGIKSISLGSLWTTDSTINDGYPFPKSMYWKYN